METNFRVTVGKIWWLQRLIEAHNRRTDDRHMSCLEFICFNLF